MPARYEQFIKDYLAHSQEAHDSNADLSISDPQLWSCDVGFLGSGRYYTWRVVAYYRVRDTGEITPRPFYFWFHGGEFRAVGHDPYVVSLTECGGKQ